MLILCEPTFQLLTLVPSSLFFFGQPRAHAGSSLADFYTLKMEAIRPSETSVHTRSIRRHIPEDAILVSNTILKFYLVEDFRSFRDIIRIPANFLVMHN
jgi:hypothetical protein